MKLFGGNIKFGLLTDVIYDVLGFFDSVMSWLAFTVGGAESPDSYKGYLEGLFGLEPRE